MKCPMCDGEYADAKCVECGNRPEYCFCRLKSDQAVFYKGMTQEDEDGEELPFEDDDSILEDMKKEKKR